MPDFGQKRYKQTKIKAHENKAGNMANQRNKVNLQKPSLQKTPRDLGLFDKRFIIFCMIEIVWHVTIIKVYNVLI